MPSLNRLWAASEQTMAFGLPQTATSRFPEQNQLLFALPDEARELIYPHLDAVELRRGDVLYESCARPRYIYFPTTSIVWLQYTLDDGASTEIAMVGKDGLVGYPLIMGGDSSPHCAVVRNAGRAYRFKGQMLQEAFSRSAPLRLLLLRYMQSLFTQIAQKALCNRHHSVQQRLCRWLLLNVDRLPPHDATITQEMIAGMLGVRRESVTEAAGHLQAVSAIQYHRGRITVLD
ncbi:MAG: Crp/Fnr family transcriptional regulator [Steroidobacteraceae bacterium]